jgi:peptidoglycan L-alanyl-D-glutamate endopeptidase CwlK|tara:strand:+ start:2867 stop:3319 length:453 start_codon:yes stop_codon:yes gene_type:complete
MTFYLSKKSLSILETVNPPLQEVTQLAIKKSRVDFGVICGVRTMAEQQALVDSGASKTMKSKHLEGNAVDVMAYVGTRGSWEITLYDDIADAFKAAAVELDIGIRWGAAWHIPDIREWFEPMQAATDNYVDVRRKEGKRPFIDAPHFELI